eukprot:COSAG01_NODE_10147_length_2236_cov_5.335049_2_plen_217_part_00
MMVVLPNREGTSRPLCQCRPLTEPPRGATKRLLRRLGAVVLREHVLHRVLGKAGTAHGCVAGSDSLLGAARVHKGGAAACKGGLVKVAFAVRKGHPGATAQRRAPECACSTVQNQLLRSRMAADQSADVLLQAEIQAGPEMYPCRPGVPRTGVGEADVAGRLALPSRAAVAVAALRLSAADCCLFHNVSWIQAGLPQARILRITFSVSRVSQSVSG